jgi:hypothetical protein
MKFLYDFLLKIKKPSIQRALSHGIIFAFTIRNFATLMFCENLLGSEIYHQMDLGI